MPPWLCSGHRWPPSSHYFWLGSSPVLTTRQTHDGCWRPVALVGPCCRGSPDGSPPRRTACAWGCPQFPPHFSSCCACCPCSHSHDRVPGREQTALATP